MTLALATEGLSEVFKSLPKAVCKKLMVHTDQGGHYTSRRYRNLLKEHEVIQSMSRRGNCLDNAPIESFFGHMKDELELQHCANLREVKEKIEQYINFYNNDRPQWALDGKTPAECRGSS